MATVTASQLRQDVYRLLDHVIETGEALEITRKGHVLRVVAEPPKARLDQIHAVQDLIVGDPEGLVDVDWSAAWDADRTLAP